MNKGISLLLIFIIALGISTCTPTKQASVERTSTPSQTAHTDLPAEPSSCKPTLDDGVSPSYKPDAPERTVVGQGHVLTGIVRSSDGCQPIPHAKLEFWPEEAGLGHSDSSRATFFADENGEYHFECNPPEHIHMRISAPGYQTIGVNSYHPEGKTEGMFDIVLVPE